jgi:lipopolysaccharide export system permease protein
MFKKRPLLKTITRHIGTQVLMTLGVATVVATFVLMLGTLTKLFDLISDGFPILVLLQFVGYQLPELLGFTLPIGVLVACLMVFSRMSADFEIIALRASGVSLYQIIAPLIILSIAVSILCSVLQFQLAPNMTRHGNWAAQEEGVKDPMIFIKEGEYVEMSKGVLIYASGKSGNSMEDVDISMFDDGVLIKVVRAASGTIDFDSDRHEIVITLFSATIEDHDDDTGDQIRITTASEYKLEPIGFGDSLAQKPLRRRYNEMTLKQLYAYINLFSERGENTMPLFVEINMRAAMAFAPFSFVILGIALGLTFHRSETSMSLIMAVVVASAYFCIMIFLDTMGDHEKYRPDMLVWLPNFICQGVGFYILWRKR